MTRPDTASTTSANHDPVVRAVTALMGAVVGLTFLFGFGNVWALALRLGVFPWVAPLVAPAVDLSILGLLLAIRRLVLDGADHSLIAPARRLLVFASLMTLALNVAEPLIKREYGRAAFDAVGPLLLIGWAEVGPGLLEALDQAAVAGQHERRAFDKIRLNPPELSTKPSDTTDVQLTPDAGDDLIKRAMQADARHWVAYRRPISAESLRKELRVGAKKSRELVTLLRSGAFPMIGKEAVP